jgi:hypothetical protein
MRHFTGTDYGGYLAGTRKAPSNGRKKSSAATRSPFPQNKRTPRSIPPSMTGHFLISGVIERLCRVRWQCRINSLNNSCVSRYCIFKRRSMNLLGVDQPGKSSQKIRAIFDLEYLWNSSRFSLFDDNTRSAILVQGGFLKISLVGLSNSHGIGLSFLRGFDF